MNITKEFIDGLSYPDFVGFINQWNVLPGSFVTISKWINYGRITDKSKILQVASTTGFQSREIAHLTGCSGVAFDLSSYAIKSANYNKEMYTPSININYIQCDGFDYNTDEKFTHILVGGGLQFFSDPAKMKARCLDFLNDEGYILASPFYVTRKIPDDLIEKAKDIFGIKVTTSSYKEVMQLYNDLEIIYEDRNKIELETEEEIIDYCTSTINRAVKMLKIEGYEELYKYMFDRLKLIKEMSNQLRPYQEYSVLVLRYRKKVYPNRFVEVF